MSWLARIEEACTAFIERTFANMFPSDVEPAHIARKLVAAMEARTRPGEDSLMSAPHRYAVRVHSSDYDRLAEHRAALEHEWAALLQEVAQRAGIALRAAPEVQLQRDEQVVAGAVDIDALDESPPLVLRVTKGMPIDGRYAVGGSAMRVGRSTESEIFLVDPSVSRHHATIEPAGGEVLVRDAGSTNGTFVNGERVRQRALQPGDRVAFGKTEMVVEGPAPP